MLTRDGNERKGNNDEYVDRRWKRVRKEDGKKTMNRCYSVYQVCMLSL